MSMGALCSIIRNAFGPTKSQETLATTTTSCRDAVPAGIVIHPPETFHLTVSPQRTNFGSGLYRPPVPQRLSDKDYVAVLNQAISQQFDGL